MTSMLRPESNGSWSCGNTRGKTEVGNRRILFLLVSGWMAPEMTWLRQPPGCEAPAYLNLIQNCGSGPGGRADAPWCSGMLPRAPGSTSLPLLLEGSGVSLGLLSHHKAGEVLLSLIRIKTHGVCREGLERWLSGEEQLLLFQGTPV